MEKYNVLLIMTDQQRWDTLGCYGNRVIETPNLDFLAAEGTLFTSAYSLTPSCIPARASLLTGMNAWNTGITGMEKHEGPMGVNYPHTLPGELTKAGYHTQGIGKMHFYPQRSLNGFHHTVLDESGRVEDPGFVSDYKAWFDKNKPGDFDIIDHGIHWNSWMARPYHAPEYLHPSNWTVNEALQFLKRKDPSKPYFLKVSFARPHSPYDAPEYYFNLYMNKSLPKPFEGEWNQIYGEPSQWASDTNAWRGRRSEEETMRAKAGYYGSIHHIDHQIGRLLSVMKKSGDFQRTLIIFTSDHGDMLGDHGLWRKTYAYEGSAHIPFIIVPPKGMNLSAGQVTNKPVVLHDIMPTVLDYMGLDIPSSVDGVSLKPLIEGKNHTWREYIHGEHTKCYADDHEMHYLTDGRYKYIWLPRLQQEQLFDLQNDPHEEHDLSEKNESELIFWRKRLISELMQRNAGWTDGHQLLSQAGKDPIQSPHYRRRLETSEYKWK